MSLSLSLWVLFGAMLHAAWNTLIKGGQDKLLDTLLVAVGAMLLALPGLWLLPPPLPAAWPYLVGSIAIHVLYFYLIIHAYRYGDLSVVYPLMRGGAPLLTSLVAVLLLGEHVSTTGLLGISLLCGGIALLAVGQWRHGADRRAVWFGLANAVVIVCYTLFDGLGARQAGHAASYTAWLFAFNALPLLAIGVWLRRATLLGQLRQGYRRMLIGGGCSVGAYGIALWAMTQAPIALVAALRESSVLFAALFGAVWLKERLSIWRAAAAMAVFSGAWMIRQG
ncbi:drug/metabolite transporter (DMT)-like permease [Chitinivorax tropicus]|uniref:Drug/metabolite transporter (DMT)-like permease n=1 Tax=Chitinivorax tropicus TaxID=714531 RepID=A0A840MRK5_9PROT|nr:DMT family transporter [Chitinivorax tropicus]MBB5019737.1 drug/metabolite transporter (DMT)-like permease [Chitinivorax tropicus]